MSNSTDWVPIVAKIATQSDRFLLMTNVCFWDSIGTFLLGNNSLLAISLNLHLESKRWYHTLESEMESWLLTCIRCRLFLLVHASLCFLKFVAIGVMTPFSIRFSLVTSTACNASILLCRTCKDNAMTNAAVENDVRNKSWCLRQWKQLIDPYLPFSKDNNALSLLYPI